MFQLNDDFLKELGLDALPSEQKQAFLETIYGQLEQQVGLRLSEGLSDEQMSQFEAFSNRDEARTREWLVSHVADYANDPAFLQIVQATQQAAAQRSEAWQEIDALSEYASLKWLSMTRPDYREVVRTTLDELKKEIVANREAILSTNQAGPTQAA